MEFDPIHATARARARVCVCVCARARLIELLARACKHCAVSVQHIMRAHACPINLYLSLFLIRAPFVSSTLSADARVSVIY